MGGDNYSWSRREEKTRSFSARGADGSYKVKTDQIFESNKKHSAHESMIPNKKNKAHLREARDSSVHPNTVPIIIALDVTGSMGDIPDNLIREGLPKIVSKIMEMGIADPAILIMAVGDSRCDGNNGVFQLGQFESGDTEMDMWLERIWISKGGGGNGGESYNWPYYYALNHVQTDAWEKRKQKGFIFTIGDDHCHDSLSLREIEEVMGQVATAKETVQTTHLVDALKEKWNVYHLELGTCKDSWGRLLGTENVIECGRRDYDGMANKIATTVASYATATPKVAVPKEEKKEEGQEGSKPTHVTPIL
jgi:hypothetical protein